MFNTIALEERFISDIIGQASDSTEINELELVALKSNIQALNESLNEQIQELEAHCAQTRQVRLLHGIYGLCVYSPIRTPHFTAPQLRASSMNSRILLLIVDRKMKRRQHKLKTTSKLNRRSLMNS